LSHNSKLCSASLNDTTEFRLRDLFHLKNVTDLITLLAITATTFSVHCLYKILMPNCDCRHISISHVSRARLHMTCNDLTETLQLNKHPVTRGPPYSYAVCVTWNNYRIAVRHRKGPPSQRSLTLALALTVTLNPNPSLYRPPWRFAMWTFAMAGRPPTTDRSGGERGKLGEGGEAVNALGQVYF